MDAGRPKKKRSELELLLGHGNAGGLGALSPRLPALSVSSPTLPEATAETDEQLARRLHEELNGTRITRRGNKATNEDHMPLSPASRGLVSPASHRAKAETPTAATSAQATAAVSGGAPSGRSGGHHALPALPTISENAPTSAASSAAADATTCAAASGPAGSVLAAATAAGSGFEPPSSGSGAGGAGAPRAAAGSGAGGGQGEAGAGEVMKRKRNSVPARELHLLLQQASSAAGRGDATLSPTRSARGGGAGPRSDHPSIANLSSQPSAKTSAADGPSGCAPQKDGDEGHTASVTRTAPAGPPEAVATVAPAPAASLPPALLPALLPSLPPSLPPKLKQRYLAAMANPSAKPLPLGCWSGSSSRAVAAPGGVSSVTTAAAPAATPGDAMGGQTVLPTGQSMEGCSTASKSQTSKGAGGTASASTAAVVGGTTAGASGTAAKAAAAANATGASVGGCSSTDETENDNDHGSGAAVAGVGTSGPSATSPKALVSTPSPASASAASQLQRQQPSAGAQPEAEVATTTAGATQTRQQQAALKVQKLPMIRAGRGWYRGRLLRESQDGSRVLVDVPGAPNPGGGQTFWLEATSDRIWRGSYKGKDWKYLGDGAWDPKPGAFKRGKQGTSSNGLPLPLPPWAVAAGVGGEAAPAQGPGPLPADDDHAAPGGRSRRRELRSSGSEDTSESAEEEEQEQSQQQQPPAGAATERASTEVGEESCPNTRLWSQRCSKSPPRTVADVAAVPVLVPVPEGIKASSGADIAPTGGSSSSSVITCEDTQHHAGDMGQATQRESPAGEEAKAAPSGVTAAVAPPPEAEDDGASRVDVDDAQTDTAPGPTTAAPGQNEEGQRCVAGEEARAPTEAHVAATAAGPAGEEAAGEGTAAVVGTSATTPAKGVALPAERVATKEEAVKVAAPVPVPAADVGTGVPAVREDADDITWLPGASYPRRKRAALAVRRRRQQLWRSPLDDPSPFLTHQQLHVHGHNRHGVFSGDESAGEGDGAAAGSGAAWGGELGGRRGSEANGDGTGGNTGRRRAAARAAEVAAAAARAEAEAEMEEQEEILMGRRPPHKERGEREPRCHLHQHALQSGKRAANHQHTSAQAIHNHQHHRSRSGVKLYDDLYGDSSGGGAGDDVIMTDAAAPGPDAAGGAAGGPQGLQSSSVRQLPRSGHGGQSQPGNTEFGSGGSLAWEASSGQWMQGAALPAGGNSGQGQGLPGPQRSRRKGKPSRSRMDGEGDVWSYCDEAWQMEARGAARARMPESLRRLYYASSAPAALPDNILEGPKGANGGEGHGGAKHGPAHGRPPNPYQRQSGASCYYQAASNKRQREYEDDLSMSPDDLEPMEDDVEQDADYVPSGSRRGAGGGNGGYGGRRHSANGGTAGAHGGAFCSSQAMTKRLQRGYGGYGDGGMSLWSGAAEGGVQQVPRRHILVSCGVLGRDWPVGGVASSRADAAQGGIPSALAGLLEAALGHQPVGHQPSETALAAGGTASAAVAGVPAVKVEEAGALLRVPAAPAGGVQGGCGEGGTPAAGDSALPAVAQQSAHVALSESSVDHSPGSSREEGAGGGRCGGATGGTAGASLAADADRPGSVLASTSFARSCDIAAGSSGGGGTGGSPPPPSAVQLRPGTPTRARRTGRPPSATLGSGAPLPKLPALSPSASLRLQMASLGGGGACATAVGGAAGTVVASTGTSDGLPAMPRLPQLSRLPQEPPVATGGQEGGLQPGAGEGPAPKPATAAPATSCDAEAAAPPDVVVRVLLSTPASPAVVAAESAPHPAASKANPAASGAASFTLWQQPPGSAPCTTGPTGPQPQSQVSVRHLDVIQVDSATACGANMPPAPPTPAPRAPASGAFDIAGPPAPASGAVAAVSCRGGTGGGVLTAISALLHDCQPAMQQLALRAQLKLDSLGLAVTTGYVPIGRASNGTHRPSDTAAELHLGVGLMQRQPSSAGPGSGSLAAPPVPEAVVAALPSVDVVVNLFSVRTPFGGAQQALADLVGGAAALPLFR